MLKLPKIITLGVFMPEFTNLDWANERKIIDPSNDISVGAEST